MLVRFDGLLNLYLWSFKLICGPFIYGFSHSFLLNARGYDEQERN